MKHTDMRAEVAPRVHKRMRQLLAAIAPPDGPSPDTRWALCISEEALVHATVYFGHLLAQAGGGLRTSEAAQQLVAKASLHLAACVVIADKFCNDSPTKNMLGLIASAAKLSSAELCRAEMDAWCTLLDGSGMLVGPNKYRSFSQLVRDTAWEQISVDDTLALLVRAARWHLSTTTTVLMSNDVPPTPTTTTASTITRAPPPVAGTSRSMARSSLSGASDAVSGIVGRIRSSSSSVASLRSFQSRVVIKRGSCSYYGGTTTTGGHDNKLSVYVVDGHR